MQHFGGSRLERPRLRLVHPLFVDEHRAGAQTRTVKIPLPAVDPLGEALHFLRMTGVLYCRAELTAPWSLRLPAFEDCLMFHFVTSGRCLVQVEGCEDHDLQPGQFALVPHGAGHQLTSEHGVTPVNLFDLPRERVSDRYEVLRHGGGGEATTIAGGAVCFDHPAADRLVTLLPKASESESGRGLVRIVLEVQPKTYFIKTVSIHEISGNISTFQFSSLKPNAGLKADLFKFEVPPGVEVVKASSFVPQQ